MTEKKKAIYFEAERIFGEWFAGKNRHKIQGFDMIDSDLNLLLAYIKCLPPTEIHPTLDRLLTSPFLERYFKDKKKKSLYFPNSIPTITFVEIKYPYVEEYETIVQRHGLKKFIVCDDKTNTPLTDCFYHSSGGYPVYMCFVRIGDICIVNMLPGIAAKKETEEKK